MEITKGTLSGTLQLFSIGSSMEEDASAELQKAWYVAIHITVAARTMGRSSFGPWNETQIPAGAIIRPENN